jgi:hypothetical protein
MKKLGSILLVLAVAGTVLAAANAGSLAIGKAKPKGKAFCKRTASKAKPYVVAHGKVSALKPADISPVPSGGCPKTVMTAAAAGTPFAVQLTGDAESPAGDPVATGAGTFRLRKGQGQVCYQLSASNLPPAAAAHIHNGAAGVSGPVVVPLFTPGADGKSSGCIGASRAIVAAILKSPASYYANVHTAEFAGGAIRGQLAGSSANLGTSFSIDLKGSTEPNAKGTAVVRVRKDAGVVCYRLHADSVTLPTVAAHIHRGGPTVSGPVVVPFQAPGATGNSDGCATAQPAIIDEILANPANFYVNVHTTEHPAGAMRAQLG